MEDGERTVKIIADALGVDNEDIPIDAAITIEMKLFAKSKETKENKMSFMSVETKALRQEAVNTIKEFMLTSPVPTSDHVVQLDKLKKALTRFEETEGLQVTFKE
jgi:hypothetical protein